MLSLSRSYEKATADINEPCITEIPFLENRNGVITIQNQTAPIHNKTRYMIKIHGNIY